MPVFVTFVPAVAIGFVLGRFACGTDVARVKAQGTGKRFIAATVLVVVPNFTDPNVWALRPGRQGGVRCEV
jgi:hypothetical protein